MKKGEKHRERWQRMPKGKVMKGRSAEKKIAEKKIADYQWFIPVIKDNEEWKRWLINVGTDSRWI